MNQNISVPDVVANLYRSLTADDLTQTLQDNHNPRECIIQFGETALDFASRLLEDEGIFYFFQQGAGAPALAWETPPRPFQPRLSEASVITATRQSRYRLVRLSHVPALDAEINPHFYHPRL